MRRRLAIFLLLLAGCGTATVPSASPERGGNQGTIRALQSGTHWTEAKDFRTLKDIGYQFAIIDFPPDDPRAWQDAVEQAERTGIKLIAGLYPPPYIRQRNGTWTIKPQGTAFLNLLRAHEQAVLAVFVYNEPYSSDPNPGGRQYDCGFYSATDLRQLRSTIQAVWPSAKIFHDLGDPSTWAPGGNWWQTKQDCIRDKYADQTGVADYVGVWDYPFEVRKPFQKKRMLETLTRELNFVDTSMKPARAIVDAQAFASRSDRNRWPSKEEMREYNCVLRQLPAGFVSWYVWRQPARYDDYLVNHPDYWPLTVADACSGRR